MQKNACRQRIRLWAGYLSIAGFLLAPNSVSADASVEAFYAGPGQQMRFIVRTSPGGEYDLATRILARHMGKYIPGNPSLAAVNMPGGGGISAANYVGLVAPRDGTVLSIIGQGLFADQALGLSPGLKVDLRDLSWIANFAPSNPILVVWHTSATKSLKDAMHRETVLGATGAGSVSVHFPTLYNNVLGTKFKLITGYPGGQEINLAMERGEIEGRASNTYAGYMASNPTFIPQKIVIPLIQIGLRKEVGLLDTPLLLDQPVKPEDKPIVDFMSKSAGLGRPLATTPGVPPERLAALRTALTATFKDPTFIVEAERQGLSIEVQPWQIIDGIIRDMVEVPQATKDKVKLFTTPGPNERK